MYLVSFLSFLARSYTGAGNHARRKRLFRSADRTAGFEDEDGYPIDGMTEDGSPLEVASCPPSKRGFPFRRHSSAEAGVLQYKTEGGLVVGMPDIVEQVVSGVSLLLFLLFFMLLFVFVLLVEW